MQTNKIGFISSILFFALSNFSYAGPYSTEPAQVTTFDQQQLNALWTIPTTPVKAAVLIIQGSGNVDLNGDVSAPMIGSGYHGQSTKLSEQTAIALANAGIASLRYSKRGFDHPEQLINQTMSYLQTDALSALDMVQKRYSSVPVSIVGFSEGALVASLIATQVRVQNLYLLSLPTRPIDEMISYQFFGWPTELLESKLDVNQDGILSEAELSHLPQATLPLIGATWDAADVNKDKNLSFVNELIPAYQNFYFAVRGLLGTPAYKGWYESLKALSPFSEIASQIQASSIYVYQGMKDPQVRWNWVVEDLEFFSVKPTLKLYSDMGHCFSPLDGALGEIKTSGPFSDELLNQLVTDISLGLSN